LSFYGLWKPVPGEVIRTRWGELVVDALDNLHTRLRSVESSMYGGYIYSDLLPAKDLAYLLGRSDLRFKEVHSGYGYFTYDVFIGGKSISELVSEVAVTPTKSAVDEYGYAHADLKPTTDFEYSLGIDGYRWKEVKAGYGYFVYEVFVADKKVLKDGDPVYIADLYPEAKAKITEAIDESYVHNIYSTLLSIETKLGDIQTNVREIKDTTTAIYSGYTLADIYSTLSSIEEELSFLIEGKTPKLLAIQVNYLAPNFADIFADDVLVTKDGRVRVKIAMDSGGYVYMKWVPAGLTEAILAMLNAGQPIPARAWHEFDFTVVKGDKVNLRVTPGQKVTVAIYNIWGA